MAAYPLLGEGRGWKMHVNRKDVMLIMTIRYRKSTPYPPPAGDILRFEGGLILKSEIPGRLSALDNRLRIFLNVSQITKMEVERSDIPP